MWLGTARQRYHKATRPGRYGFTVIAMPDGTAELTDALPLEYLERLLLQNSLFNDDLRLEGVAVERERLVILTSQPNLTGDEATGQDMLTFMRKLWFLPLTGLSIGRPGALAFYRDLDEVAAFDAHPGNFVKDDDGHVLPIDLILVRADEPLQKALQAHLN